MFTVLTTTCTQDALTIRYPTQFAVHRHPTPVDTLSPLTSNTNPQVGHQEEHKTDPRTEIKTKSPRTGAKATTVDRIGARQGKQYDRPPCEAAPRAVEGSYNSAICKPTEHTGHRQNDGRQKGCTRHRGTLPDGGDTPCEGHTSPRRSPIEVDTTHFQTNNPGNNRQA